MNNITRYSVLQQKLHWVVVVLVGVQYLLQSPMRAAMSAISNDEQLSGLDFLVTTMHTWGGIAVGAIMVYRLRLRVQKPVMIGGGTLRGVTGIIASGVHWGFYVLLFSMVITGMLHYYLELHWVAIWHERGEWLLLGMIGVHGLAALLHHFWKKDGVLRQMCGRRPPH